MINRAIVVALVAICALPPSVPAQASLQWVTEKKLRRQLVNKLMNATEELQRIHGRRLQASCQGNTPAPPSFVESGNASLAIAAETYVVMTEHGSQEDCESGIEPLEDSKTTAITVGTYIAMVAGATGSSCQTVESGRKMTFEGSGGHCYFRYYCDDSNCSGRSNAVHLAAGMPVCTESGMKMVCTDQQPDLGCVDFDAFNEGMRCASDCGSNETAAPTVQFEPTPAPTEECTETKNLTQEDLDEAPVCMSDCSDVVEATDAVLKWIHGCDCGARKRVQAANAKQGSVLWCLSAVATASAVMFSIL